MKKLKVCVYAISKNEEKFVDRWYESMKEADYIYVLDTDSTDNTVEKLKKLGVTVKSEIIEPWRFDVARNKSLDMIPDDVDVCVCTDLDEVFLPGWRNTLEQLWDTNIDQIAYNYNWALDKNNKPLVNFYAEKIHSRNNFKWTHPVHEILTKINQDNKIKKYTNDITLNHYPDLNKSRNSYLKLLELSVKENPNDDRNMHYLGREYMYHKKWNKAIDILICHLNLNGATWKDERCASMRFIARCYINLNRYEEAKMWFDKAIEEAPYLRDPYVEKALLEYDLNNLKEVKKLCLKALKITSHEKTYINEIFSWNETVYDLLSICYFNENKYALALKNINKALKINPKDKRLQKNKSIIKSYIKK